MRFNNYSWIRMQAQRDINLINEQSMYEIGPIGIIKFGFLDLECNFLEVLESFGVSRIIA